MVKRFPKRKGVKWRRWRGRGRARKGMKKYDGIRENNEGRNSKERGKNFARHNK